MKLAPTSRNQPTTTDHGSAAPSASDKESSICTVTVSGQTFRAPRDILEKIPYFARAIATNPTRANFECFRHAATFAEIIHFAGNKPKFPTGLPESN
ncbi:MAG: hypothetical protein EOO40_03875, partial [Deltaproteobacteria bacterium]